MTRPELMSAIDDLVIRLHNALVGRWPRAAYRLSRLWCGVRGHPRIIYGPARDICLDCLSIVDEHLEGRGRTLR